MLPRRGPYQKTERGIDQIPLFVVGLDRVRSAMVVLLVLCLSTVSQETGSGIGQRVASATTIGTQKVNSPS